jgi:hypothetical protein
MRKRALAATAVALLAAGGVRLVARPAYWRAGKMLSALVVRARAARGAAQDPLVEEDLTVDGADGRFARASTACAARPRARADRRARHPPRGMNERRMVPFARELARAGLVVLTPR